MAKIVTVIHFPTLTVEDLKDLVVANDTSSDDHPIDKEHVEPRHVIDLMSAGEFPDVPSESDVRFED